MNLLLLNPSDVANNLAYVSGRQLAQLLTVHNSAVGDSVRVGMVDGQMGNGRVLSIDAQHATLEVVFYLAPPSPLPLTLILALPRPKMLRRTLQTVATMGVKQLYLINSFRVEKSYWQSPLLAPEAIAEDFRLGLEQARDTVLPQLHVRKRFKPFVEDELPALVKNTTALLAHPVADQRCPINIHAPTTLVIGPEGGFI
ncbi:MAG: 16S rRNA (uracil(1498)-N(3))-methyltransferase, partial [Porticoccaceae bacterium]